MHELAEINDLVGRAGSYASLWFSTDTAEPYISQAEAGKYLGVTDRTIRQMIPDGRLRAYAHGARVIRLRLDEIEAAMQPVGSA